MSYEYVKVFRQKLKMNLLYVHGDNCAICGYNKCPSALEFHHLDPEQKEFTLGTNTNKSTEIALNETKKCILVCANCHREIHANLLNINLSSSYSEERAQMVLEQLELQKTKTKYYCLDCGAEIVEKRAKRCVACSLKARQVCERPSREELKNLKNVYNRIYSNQLNYSPKYIAEDRPRRSAS